MSLSPIDVSPSLHSLKITEKNINHQVKINEINPPQNKIFPMGRGPSGEKGDRCNIFSPENKVSKYIYIF